MYKLEFTLKQHTPLIHFQHDQEGATLRASEVKPKLDQFIIEKLLKEQNVNFDYYKTQPDSSKKFINAREAFKLETKDPQTEIQKKWVSLLVGKGNNEHVALDYKLVIQPVDNESIDKYVIASYIPKQTLIDYERKGLKIIDRSPYFADNNPIKKGDLRETKLGLMLKNGKELKLIFRYFDLDLEKLLNEVLPSFFVTTNFGSRQSKGFGCYLPKDFDRQKFETNLKTYFPVIFKLTMVEGSMGSIFAEINSVYKTLKSGDRIIESELRKYFNEFRPVIEWEKPAIQEKVAEISGSNLRVKSKSQNRQFVRALLGLAEIYEYPKQDGIKAQVVHNNDIKDTDKSTQRKIERYRSPILFKIFDNHIYMLAVSNEFGNKILNESFRFDFKHRGRNYPNMLSLKTPEKFDLEEFVIFAMKSQKKWKQVAIL